MLRNTRMSESPDAIKVHNELDHPEEEGAGRYVAYVSRLKTILTTGSRYIAYSSDIGEAFRPLTRPAVVTAAYGISWAYVFSDVGSVCLHASKMLEKNHRNFNEDIAWIAARRMTFQTLARYVPIYANQYRSACVSADQPHLQSTVSCTTRFQCLHACATCACVQWAQRLPAS